MISEKSKISTANQLFPMNLSSPVRLEILSNTSGRIRLRFLPECRDLELMTEVSTTARLMLGSAKTVRLNPTIGTLTITYETGELDITELGQTLTALGIEFVTETPNVAGANVSEQLKQVVSGWNKRVNHATGGTSDLRVLVPFFLGLLALRQVLNKNSPRLRLAPWYMLAWYAFDSFMQLNRSTESRINRAFAPTNIPSNTSAISKSSSPEMSVETVENFEH